MYKGERLGAQRLDMVVDDLVVVEAKSTALLAENASRQLYNYLRCTTFEVGLLIHFGPKPLFSRCICENRFKPQHVESVKSASSVPSVSPLPPSDQSHHE
jgi:recombinational DNA repair protein (RecF pathway)